MPNYQLPITHYQLPITNYQLPITNYPLPITNSMNQRKFFDIGRDICDCGFHVLNDVVAIQVLS